MKKETEGFPTAPRGLLGPGIIETSRRVTVPSCLGLLPSRSMALFLVVEEHSERR